VLLEELEQVRESGITPIELEKAKAQLKARFTFDNDSITSIAHQIGYFETVDNVALYTGLTARVDEVTLEAVAGAARLLQASNRTIGVFDPLPVDDSDQPGAAGSER
jgi:predicted Zn-dependent peptidase